jgi:hypothetical protein
LSWLRRAGSDCRCAHETGFSAARNDVTQCLFMARMRPTGRADQCPKLGVERTQSGHAATAESDPGCVKTHTSAKCRKHNSPAMHRTSRVQYDLTPRDAIARRYFYVCCERWSFRTAKTHLGHSAIQSCCNTQQRLRRGVSVRPPLWAAPHPHRVSNRVESDTKSAIRINR